MIELKPHQLKASNEIIQKLLNYKFCMLSGEPRTGKTLTIIDVVNALCAKEKTYNFTVLIVTKLNAINSIKNDINNYQIARIVNIEIINFESIHKSKLKYYDVLIIDEVHSIGYIQKPKLINKRLSDIKYKYYAGMSGTLFLETFSTAYSLFPKAFNSYKNFYQWAKDFVDVKEKRIGQIKIKDYTKVKNVEDIMKIIKPYIVTMTQQDAGFNTKVNDVLHFVNSDNINKLCKIIKEKKQYQFRNEKVFVAENISMEFQAIKQLQSGGLKIMNAENDYLILDNFKIDYIKKFFKGKKIAIYYTYIIEKMLIEDNFENLTNDDKVFNSTDYNTVYYGQFRSRREGVNLSSSNDMIFMSMPYSNLSFLQARERCILRDKTEPINCHLLLTKFDAKVYDIVINEKGVFNAECYKKLNHDFDLI